MLELRWMRPQAPYMPIATIGLLAALHEGGHEARAGWSGAAERATLVVHTDIAQDAVGTLLLDLPWPSLDRLPPIGTPWKQGLKPTLKTTERPAEAFRSLLEGAAPLEARLLRAIVTDAVLDGDGLPSRSRLLRGVKADLSSIAKPPKRMTADGLAAELRDGPDFRRGESGLGLGLVPEVQTFGGTTGPDASTVGAYSPLLYLLLWRGIMALPPVAVLRGRRRSVGGPLVTKPDVISWPRWHFPADLRTLRGLFSLLQVHADEPSASELRKRNLEAVYRARAVPLSTMVAVFRWGERVV
ncbi:MAG: hypothetical protein WKF96_09475 [Solirubrobacteraceae bacterium]